MSNGKKTSAILIGAIYAVIFAVLNLLIFVIFKPGNIDNDVAKRNFWITYAFLVITFILQVASIFTFDRKSGLNAVFFGLPIFVVSAIFLGIEVVVAVIFFILSAFNVALPTTVVVVIQILILAAYIVITLLSLLVKNHIVKLDESIKQNVTNIRNLQADVLVAMEACDNAHVKELLRKFADDIRFSDPMTVPAVEVLDVQIQTTVMEIKTAVYEGKLDLVESLVRKGSLQLKERNLKISNSK